MSNFISTANSFADAVPDRVWSVAWQWTVLVLLAALPAQWLLRSHAPALRYWVWQIALLKLLVLPLWTYSLPVSWLPASPAPIVEEPRYVQPIPTEFIPTPERSIPEDSTPSAVQTEAAPSAIPAPIRPSLTWRAWLIVSWSAIVLLHFARLVRQRFHLSQLLSATNPADADLTAAVAEAAAALGSKSPPRVLVTERNVSPFVCGMFDHRLVLPRSLAASLNRGELRQVLIHELSHIQRRDLVWGWIPELTGTLWWFHPVVHWVTYRLRLERELACDQLAMAHSGNNASSYAATLVQVVIQTSQPAIPNSVLMASADSSSNAASRK